MQKTFNVFHAKTLVQCSFLIALSIVLTHVFTISTPFLRFNLGSLPVLLAGVLFGPIGGGIVGALADLIGGTLAGYSINLMITLGTAMVGVLMGVCYWYFPCTKTPKLLWGVLLGNLVGSIVINSLALHFYFGMTFEVLLLRVPNNIIVGTAEFFILRYLLHHRAFCKALALTE